MNKDWIKSKLIGTPLQPMITWAQRMIHPPRYPAAVIGLEESEAADKILARVIRSDSNCIDVGAHLGSVLARICKLAPRGRHFAFEPVPTKFEWLRKKFPRCQVLNLALSDRDGTASFTHVQTRSGYSGLRSRADTNDRVNVIEVKMARLDEILPADYRVDFLKIDVEGAELHALEGASGTIARDHPVILFECMKASCDLYGYGPDAIHDLLTGRCGLSIFRLRDWLAGRAPISRDQFVQATESVDPAVMAFNFLAAHAPS
ncbi:MAG: FkbM family methyltransferase [Phycisphaeraceae bacterium]|nr:FkbM family methyltransferase [Phycisphaeraceae bacterium]